MSSGTQVQNARGEWVPAFPEPWFYPIIGCECACGRRFLTRQGYYEHYAYAHILGHEPNP